MNRVVTLRDQSNCYNDELAKVIASILDNGQYDELYEPIFKVRKALLIRNTDMREFLLSSKIARWHAYLEAVGKSMGLEADNREAYKKVLTDPLIKERMAEYTEEAFTYIQGIPDPDTSLPLLLMGCIARLTELEDITEMADVTEQAEAFANYYAKEIIRKIRQLLERTASRETLEAEDIQRIIKTVYLDKTYRNEKEGLARIFGRDDIIEKCETATDRVIREAREKRLTKLLTVLHNRIAQKGA